MRYLTLIPLILLLFTTPLRAMGYETLYQAEVGVADQGANARAKGMQQALGEVLLKVSGTARVLESAPIIEAMKSASRHVQQYRYGSEAIPASQQPNDQGGGSADTRVLLSVRFDQSSVDDLLRNNGFTVWGDARPSTLVWLGVEKRGSREIVGANDVGPEHTAVMQAAQRRALPIKLPLMDLTDQSRVRPVDVWGEFSDTIIAASDRYAPQAILIGRVYSTSSRRWEARWTLHYQGEAIRWAEQAGSPAVLISGGINETAEQLVSRFSQSFVGGSGSMLLQVDDITSLRDYRRVHGYLSGVHGVRAVIPEQINAGSVRFNLQTAGGSDAVLQVIALGDTLERVAQPLMPVSPQMPSRRQTSPGAATVPDVAQPVEAPLPQVRVYRLLP